MQPTLARFSQKTTMTADYLATHGWTNTFITHACVMNEYVGLVNSLVSLKVIINVFYFKWKSCPLKPVLCRCLLANMSSHCLCLPRVVCLGSCEVAPVHGKCFLLCYIFTRSWKIMVLVVLGKQVARWSRCCMSTWFPVQTCFRRSFSEYSGFSPAPKTVIL